MLKINPAVCPQNHKCPLVAKCPAEAIKQEGFSLPVIDNNVCIECGYCSSHCPMNAVEDY